MKKHRLTGGLALIALAGLILSSCETTRNNAYLQADAAVVQRDWAKAIAALEATQPSPVYGDKDLVLRGLDLGLLRHRAAGWAASNRELEEAERLISDYFTKSISSAAASIIANDNALEYEGEAYEDIYLNVIKALNYASLGDFDGSWVEIRRMNGKLELLEDRYRQLAQEYNRSEKGRGQFQAPDLEFRDSALARWLSAVLYRADGRPDDARIDLDKLAAAQAGQRAVYPFPAWVDQGFLAENGQARLSLIGFSGRAPLKKASTYRLNTLRNAIAVSREEEDSQGRMRLSNLAAIPFPGVAAGLNFKCQVPNLVLQPQKVRRAVLLVDNQPLGDLSLLEDIGLVARATFKPKEALIYTKTIIRTVAKGVAAKLAKDEVNKRARGAGLGTGGELLGAVFGLATDAVVEVSEQADLRTGRYLPGQAWVGDFSLPAGRHELAVHYFDGAGRLLAIDSLGQREIGARGLNLYASWSDQ